jgi:preprotein translocase subunit SecA
MNNMNQEKEFENINVGDIFIATNLAGRGTDIKTEDDIERNGGLHVILTFLP